MESAVDVVKQVTTAKMRLVPAGMADFNDIATLHADERVWRHRPEGRHTTLEYTRTKVHAMEEQWSRDGLGYWVARLRRPVAGLTAGTCVGVGGCAVETHKGSWNLYYRFRPESQGNGLASELCRAALTAAHAVDPSRPVVASLVEDNIASRATAERAGLSLQWRGADPSRDGEIRLIFADRTLEDSVLAELVDH